jgi:hypothetical protein
VWIVGEDDNTTLIERWNGSNWAVVSSPNESCGGELTSALALWPTGIWATGNAGNDFQLNLGRALERIEVGVVHHPQPRLES